MAAKIRPHLDRVGRRSLRRLHSNEHDLVVAVLMRELESAFDRELSARRVSQVKQRSLSQ